jgi:hypothetical protein
MKNIKKLDNIINRHLYFIQDSCCIVSYICYYQLQSMYDLYGRLVDLSRKRRYKAKRDAMRCRAM